MELVYIFLILNLHSDMYFLKKANLLQNSSLYTYVRY